MKSIRILATAGLLAAVSAGPALAWSGDLVRCLPTAGSIVDVTFKKGLVCQDTFNKIGIALKAKNVGLTDASLGAPLNQPLNNCVANPAAPWDAWVAGKFGKTSAAAAATIAQAELTLKGQTFGSCNFGGSPTSGGASGAGAVTFLTSGGDKVKGASLKFFGTVSGDAATYSAIASGLVTKGLGLGGDIEINVGLSLASPENQTLLACNTGAICSDPTNLSAADDPFQRATCEGDTAPIPNANGTSCVDDTTCGTGTCTGDPQAPASILKVITGPSGPVPQSSLYVTFGEPDPNDPNDDFSAIP